MVSGTVTAAAGEAGGAPDFSRVRLRLTADSTALPFPGGGYTVPVKADGTFSIAILPGRYRIHVTAPAGWSLKTALIGTTDGANAFFEVPRGSAIADAVVTLTSKGAELTGRMIDASGASAHEFFVIVFPADPALWGWQVRRIQQVRPGIDGTFSFRNLPPGHYLLAAVTDVDQNEWFDPEFLRMLSASAIPITLAEGDRKTQTIQIK